MHWRRPLRVTMSMSGQVASTVRPNCPASRMASKNRGRRERPVAPVRQGDPNWGSAESLWTKTRSGARAGRGFHYQDAVGAQLCGRVLSNRLVIDRIVPEGFEDLSWEGPTSWHVQVKSRQERVGDFTAVDVAGQLVSMAKAHAKRGAAGVTDRAILILERPVTGELFTHWDRPLSTLPTDHPVLRQFDLRDVAALERNARRALGKQPSGRLTYLVGVNWRPPAAGADRCAACGGSARSPTGRRRQPIPIPMPDRSVTVSPGTPG